MEKRVGAAIAGRGIKRISDYRELGLEPETYRDEKVFAVLNRFAADLGEGIVLYGGITATERIYGLKRIRDISTDLDFVCSAKGMAELLDHYSGAGPSRIRGRDERLLYHEDYDILFTVASNLPVSFTLGHIHDWPVDEVFFARSETRQPAGVPVRCASREHSIMLKLRRTRERLGKGLAPFGKDALDVLNMLAAPCCRDDMTPIDAGFLAGLIKEGLGSDSEEFGALLAFVRGHSLHLSAREREAVDPVLAALGAAFAEDLSS